MHGFECDIFDRSFVSSPERCGMVDRLYAHVSLGTLVWARHTQQNLPLCGLVHTREWTHLHSQMQRLWYYRVPQGSSMQLSRAHGTQKRSLGVIPRCPSSKGQSKRRQLREESVGFGFRLINLPPLRRICPSGWMFRTDMLLE